MRDSYFGYAPSELGAMPQTDSLHEVPSLQLAPWATSHQHQAQSSLGRFDRQIEAAVLRNLSQTRQ
jgi:hypothetical protein